MENATVAAKPQELPVDANVEGTTAAEATAGAAVETKQTEDVKAAAAEEQEAKTPHASQEDNNSDSHEEPATRKEDEEEDKKSAENNTNNTNNNNEEEEEPQEEEMTAVNEGMAVPVQQPSPASPLVHLNSIAQPHVAPPHAASPDRLHRRKANGALMSDSNNTNTNTHHSNGKSRRSAALSRSAAKGRAPITHNTPSTTIAAATTTVKMDAEGVPVAPATTAELPTTNTHHTNEEGAAVEEEQQQQPAAEKEEGQEEAAAAAANETEESPTAAAASHKAKHTATAVHKKASTPHATKKAAAASSSSLPSSQPKNASTSDLPRKSASGTTTPQAARRRHLVPAHMSTSALLHEKTDRPTSYETSNSVSHTTQMADDAYMQGMMKKYHTPSTTLTRRSGVVRKAHKLPRTEAHDKTETSAATATTTNETHKAAHSHSHHQNTAKAKTTAAKTRPFCQRRLRFDDAGLCALRQQLQRLLAPTHPSSPPLLPISANNGRGTGKSASRSRARGASPAATALDAAAHDALAALPFNITSDTADAVPALPRALEMSLVTLYEEALTQLAPSLRDQLVLRLSPHASRSIVLDCVKRRFARLQPTPLRRYNSSLPGALTERGLAGRHTASMPSAYNTRPTRPYGTASTQREERSAMREEGAAVAEAMTQPSEPVLGGYRQPYRHSQRRHLRPAATPTAELPGSAQGPLEEFCTAFATEVRAMFIEDCALACLRAQRRHEKRQNNNNSNNSNNTAAAAAEKDVYGEPHEEDEDEARLRACYSRAVQAHLHRLLGCQIQPEAQYVEGLVTILYPWLNAESKAEEEEEKAAAEQGHATDRTGMIDYFILLVTEGQPEETNELHVMECGEAAAEENKNRNEEEEEPAAEMSESAAAAMEENGLEPEVVAPAQPVMAQ